MKTFLYKTSPDLNATWIKSQIAGCLLRLSKHPEFKISSSSSMLFTNNDDDDYIFISIDVFVVHHKKKVCSTLHIKIYKPCTIAIMSAFKESFRTTIRKISTNGFHTLQAIVKRQKAQRKYSYSKSWVLEVSPNAVVKVS